MYWPGWFAGRGAVEESNPNSCEMIIIINVRALYWYNNTIIAIF